MAKLDPHNFLLGVIRRAAKRLGTGAEARRRNKIKRNCYICAMCKGQFKKRQTQEDHIIPCQPVWMNKRNWDWNIFIQNAYFVSVEGIQILCKRCHYKKSALENKERRKNKCPSS